MTKFQLRLLIIGIFGIAAVIVAIKLFSTESKSNEVAKVVTRLSFHPDKILQIQWQTAGKTFSYSRENSSQLWSESSDSPRIQKLLNLLTLIHEEKVESVSQPFVTVIFEDSDKQIWRANWSPGLIAWADGPLKGWGKKLSAEHDEFFFAGRFALEKWRIKLCPARIRSISRAAKTVKFKQDNSFETWMSRNCNIVPEKMFDRLLQSFDLKNFATIKFEFENDSKSVIRKNESIFIMSENFAFQSSQLEAALADLSN